MYMDRTSAELVVQALCGGQTPSIGQTVQFGLNGWGFSGTGGNLFFNVLDNGVDPNSSANQDGTIQALIDLVSTQYGGGVLFFPGYTFFIQQLKLRSRIVLMGAGWKTTLQHIPSAASGKDMIVLADVNVEQTVVKDMKLYGDKTHQSNNNSAFYYHNLAGSFDTGDSHHLIENVLIKEAKAVGVVLGADSRENRLINVTVQAPGFYGFSFIDGASGSTDNYVIGCTAQAAGYSGFQGSTNTRFVGCKAFGCGAAAVSGNGRGFLVDQDRTQLIGCEAQDNQEDGFCLVNVTDCVVDGCSADTNSRNGGSHAGFRIDGGDGNLVVGRAYNRTGSSQTYGLQLAGSTTGNTCIVVSDTAYDNGGMLASNHVMFNGQSFVPADHHIYSHDLHGGPNTSLVGWYGASSVQQTHGNLTAFTNPGGGSYSGIDNTQPSTPYAQVTDLNDLGTKVGTIGGEVQELHDNLDALITKIKNCGLLHS